VIHLILLSLEKFFCDCFQQLLACNTMKKMSVHLSIEMQLIWYCIKKLFWPNCKIKCSLVFQLKWKKLSENLNFVRLYCCNIIHYGLLSYIINIVCSPTALARVFTYLPLYSIPLYLSIPWILFSKIFVYLVSSVINCHSVYTKL